MQGKKLWETASVDEAYTETYYWLNWSMVLIKSNIFKNDMTLDIGEVTEVGPCKSWNTFFLSLILICFKW